MFETSLATKLNTSDVVMLGSGSLIRLPQTWENFTESSSSFISSWCEIQKVKPWEKRAFLFFLVRQDLTSRSTCLFQGQEHIFFYLDLLFKVSIQSFACKRVFVWHIVRLSVALAVFCACLSVMCLLGIHECVWQTEGEIREVFITLLVTFSSLLLFPTLLLPALYASCCHLCCFS